MWAHNYLPITAFFTGWFLVIYHSELLFVHLCILITTGYENGFRLSLFTAALFTHNYHLCWVFLCPSIFCTAVYFCCPSFTYSTLVSPAFNSQSFAWLLSFSLTTFSSNLPIPAPQTSSALSLASTALFFISLNFVTSVSTFYLSPSPYSPKPTWISSSLQ